MAALIFGARLFAATPPATPVILEPEKDGDVVAPADVHMVTGPFSDADGDGHRCTEWEIVVAGGDSAWRAPCATGAARLHIHLGDGTFGDDHERLRELVPRRDYVLRVRHRDDSGDSATEWSAWSERLFRTAAPPAAEPMRIRDILATPPPEWNATAPEGASLRVELTDDVPLLGMQNGAFADEPAAPARSPIRIALTADREEWFVPESELTFDDENGDRRTIWIPAVVVAPGATTRFWVSANGATHHLLGDDRRVPVFDFIARGSPVPWSVRERGYVVEHVAGDLQLPLDLAFVPRPEDDPESAFFYVAELYGNVKVVTRAGEVRDFATGLLDFDPTGPIPGEGEAGVGGITVDGVTGNVLLTRVAWPDRESGLIPQIVRLHASEDGLQESGREVVLSLPNETQAPSHQISNITTGPDGKLYVHFGDAQVPENARDLSTVRGKIIRMEPDGTVPPDNPFRDESDGLTARDYIFASGFRNPFGGAWRAADRALYEVENGPAVDRFARVDAGRDYKWDGTNASMREGAVSTWSPAVAPVRVAFVQRETFDGSGFPESRQDCAFVAESGPTWAAGTQSNGKRISAIAFEGVDAGVPRPFVEYDGTGRATVAAVAAGPDGLYFSDLYRDSHYISPVDRGANVYRVRWTGYADFEAHPVTPDGLTFDFADRSDAPAGATRLWDFGDGYTSSELAPRHRFANRGARIVRLTAGGTLVETKKIRAGSGDGTLSGDYFEDAAFKMPVETRREPLLDFSWEATGIFSARWHGTLRPRFSETYRFTLETGDTARLFIDGQLVIAPNESRGTMALEADVEHEFLLELQHFHGEAFVRLTWESDSQPAQIVPRSSDLPEPVVPRRRRSAGR